MLQKSVPGILILTSALVWAGGLSIFVGHPSASPEPAASGALLLVQLQGCGNPADAKVRATATAKDAPGAPRTLSLQVIPLNKPETVVVRGDEVKRGEWTVTITADHLGYEWSATVPMKDGDFNRKEIRQARRPLSQSTRLSLPGGATPAVH